MNRDLSVDILLCICVLVIASSMFLVKQSFTAIILFISLVLVITLCWIPLDAIDFAIAEAAIGAGLTGAMLLASWRKLSIDKPAEKKTRGDL
ncbi:MULTISPECIES: hydrogenase subunit MbhD domain-containing protein [unclassified Colwellia]|uniref:hydrogenase subunit MbhD domain-containing protein n=1 Tax=unclassified Colwellia TaxID=196834 RepID=UPI0015F48847|nr:MULTISPECIES: hydrogenase subunit MbhD domain-containing protein [unclassified Colwellia]MBA6233683.1 DUF4040 domain-containing protein [Colwellia sp. MB02u-7]MBA6237256.1 DUF4040 domain-containing protein [Colwellia sp. MB02u-11]MBA6257250.1 DUF4040 domain-containing protein [Colwellia sp. MB3u-28]MBA6258835.1 DUF4040 domain-containing protein [Colwellia sp. MB3u-41]MBA6300500.1 DUF4040 domain-containing protein [Colwellia sp. MB3u-22]